MAAAGGNAKAQYSAIVLGATGNVGGRIMQLLVKNPQCKKVVMVTRRETGAFSDPKVSEVVVNMDRLPVNSMILRPCPAFLAATPVTVPTQICSFHA